MATVSVDFRATVSFGAKSYYLECNLSAAFVSFAVVAETVMFLLTLDAVSFDGGCSGGDGAGDDKLLEWPTVAYQFN